MAISVESFFEAQSNTFTHLVIDTNSKHCAVIDSVLDFDYASGRTSTVTADQLIERIESLGLTLAWILETHIHADHLSAACYLKLCLGGRIAAGARVTEVQKVFAESFNEGDDFYHDGRQFDHLFNDGDVIELGAVSGDVLATPGHTPACISYRFGDNVFVGDTLFMTDFGSARCDFPGGDARQLYRSVRRLLALSADTKLYLCHDYTTPTRDQFVSCTTVAEQLEHNIHLSHSVSEDEFVEMRTARDKQLSMPTLILPSVQVNMRAGQLPAVESNGQRYLKVPLNLF